MTRPRVRGAIALAGSVPVRVALALGASLGLHWGAWQALADGGAHRVAAVPRETVVVASLGLVPPAPAADRATAGPGRDDATGRAAAAAGTGADPASARGPVAGPASARGPVADAASPSGPVAPPREGRPGARDDVAPRADALVFLEAWEVDHPPEFLVAPDGLDELPALAGGAARLRVSVRVDASGRRVGVDVDAPGLEPRRAARLARGVEDAFADVSFLPARLDGRPVPAVMRWSVGLDPNAPVALGFRLQN